MSDFYSHCHITQADADLLLGDETFMRSLGNFLAFADELYAHHELHETHKLPAGEVMTDADSGRQRAEHQTNGNSDN